MLLYLTSMPAFEARTRTLVKAALDCGKPVLAVMLPGHAVTVIVAPQRPADLPTALPPLDDLPQLVSAYGIAVPRAAECATPDRAERNGTHTDRQCILDI